MVAPKRRAGWLRGLSLSSRPILLFAFALAVMADPVSSVAYAIEAALRELGNDLALLLPTMALVVAIIGLIIVNYHQLLARFPQGGGAAAAVGVAFGEGFAFLPIAALIVDFALTIAISAAAGASALISYAPWLAAARVPLALGLLVAVAGLTWFGHFGRTVFALMTLAFVAVGGVVVIGALFAAPLAVPPTTATGHAAPLAVLLAFPVAMALATGVEAPSSAIAQLGQLDNRGRRRFGRITLWLTLIVVGGLTLGLTAAAVRLHVGVPAGASTQIADLARVSVSPPLFALFQVVTTLLLLAAASSSYQAGPGLLKALARLPSSTGGPTGILPAPLGTSNAHHTPYWGVGLFLLASGGVVVAAGGRDQQLVLFYAVAVFVSFLAGLLAMARLALVDRALLSLAASLLGALVVAFTLAVDATRLDADISLSVTLLLAAGLYLAWARAGRPRGIARAEAESEAWPSEGEQPTPADLRT